MLSSPAACRCAAGQPNPIGKTSKEWWESSTPADRSPELLECIQRAGDVLFVPDRWWHATLNLQVVTLGRCSLRLLS